MKMDSTYTLNFEEEELEEEDSDEVDDFDDDEVLFNPKDWSKTISTDSNILIN